MVKQPKRPQGPRLPMLTARHQHTVRTPTQLEQKQRAFLVKCAKAVGDPPIEPWPASRALVARIEYGRWLGDCDCGSGVAVEPLWAAARCFACGAVYNDVQLPDTEERLNLEYLIATRKRLNQHWLPGERLIDVAIDNASHGVKF